MHPHRHGLLKHTHIVVRQFRHLGHKRDPFPDILGPHIGGKVRRSRPPPLGLHPQIAWASLVETGMGRGYTNKDQNGLVHIGVYYMPEVNLCYHVYIYCYYVKVNLRG